MLVPYRQNHIYQYQPVRRAAYAGGLGVAASYIPRGYGMAKGIYNWYRNRAPMHGPAPRSKPLMIQAKGYGVKRRHLKPRAKGRGLKSQVKNIQRQMKSERGILIWRSKDCAPINSTVSNAAYSEYSINTVGNIETALANLRYYDPSDPATLITAAAATGTFYKSFLMKSMYGILELTNNYQVPVNVRVYICGVKDDTSITPNTAFETGLADVGNPDVTSPLCYPTDSPQFNELWRIIKSVDKKLMPGRKMSCSHSVKNINYDPSLTDSHSLTYQTRYKSFVFYVRIVGVEGHDTTVTTEQGTLAAGVDVELRKTFTVEYDAGADIKTIVLADTSDTSFTNSGVVSNMPVSDNQAYSIA